MENVENLVEEEASKIKSELNLRDSPTPTFFTLKEFLYSQEREKINIESLSEIRKSVRGQGYWFPRWYQIEPEENSIYAIFPPAIINRDRFLEKVYGSKVIKIGEEEKNKLPILYLLCIFYMNAKIERELPYSPLHFKALSKIGEIIYSKAFRKRGKLFISLSEVYAPLFVSARNVFDYMTKLFAVNYYFRKTSEVNEKLSELIASPSMKKTYKELDYMAPAKYFTTFSFILETPIRDMGIELRGKYRGEKCMNYEDFFEKEEIPPEHFLWLIGMTGKPFYIK